MRRCKLLVGVLDHAICLFRSSNEWLHHRYDMDFSGPLYSLCSFVRNVSLSSG